MTRFFHTIDSPPHRSESQLFQGMVSRIAGMPYPTIIILFYVLLIWKHINVPSHQPR